MVFVPRFGLGDFGFPFRVFPQDGNVLPSGLANHRGNLGGERFHVVDENVLGLLVEFPLCGIHFLRVEEFLGCFLLDPYFRPVVLDPGLAFPLCGSHARFKAHDDLPVFIFGEFFQIGFGEILHGISKFRPLSDGG